MYFSRIDPNNTRRFRVIDPNVGTEVLSELEMKSIWGMYDHRPGASMFLAPIGANEEGTICFVDTPHYFFRDQIEEIV